MYYEPDYKSCTKLIATVTKDKFGFDTKPLAELIHWGDIIDGAQFPTPQSATELTEPATQLGSGDRGGAGGRHSSPHHSGAGLPASRRDGQLCRSSPSTSALCWSDIASRSTSCGNAAKPKMA